MRDSYAIKFGERLRTLRESKEMSQEQLADNAKLHRTHISLIERGRRSARVETIEKLAIALGVQPGELMPEILLSRTRK